MAFTIFQDTPTMTATTMRTRSATISSAVGSLTTEADKENLHPVTGQRTGPTTDTTAKKRKNSISSVKALAPIEVKKMKETGSSEPDAKKRKPLSSGSTAATRKTKPSGKKDGKGSGSTRKPTKRSSRAPSPMPKVDEEGQADNMHTLSQQEIDAKCYDLTVKPLADVSQAFSQATPLTWLEEEPEDSEQVKLQFVKEASQEPDLGDLFTPASVGYASFDSTRSTSVSGSQEPATLSTPDRKQLYHCFTFSSPSPIRLPKITRSASVPRLDIPSPSKSTTA